MDFVPIKVKIGLRPNGHADHPDWFQLPCISSEADYKTHIRGGWRYDKKYGHKEEGPDSPFGMQWGMLFVSKQFAQEALVAFPTLITVLTEAEAESFYEERVTAHMPENRANLPVLQALETELNLRKALGQDTATLEAKIAKALDPNDDSEPGLIKDPIKIFTDVKTREDIAVIGIG